MYTTVTFLSTHCNITETVSFPKLRRVQFHRCNITDSVGFPKLRRVQFHRCNITGSVGFPTARGRLWVFTIVSGILLLWQFISMKDQKNMATSKIWVLTSGSQREFHSVRDFSFSVLLCMNIYEFEKVSHAASPICVLWIESAHSAVFFLLLIRLKNVNC